VDLAIICQAQRRQSLAYNELVWATQSYFAGNVIFAHFEFARARCATPTRCAACVHGSCLHKPPSIIDTDSSGIAQRTRHCLPHVDVFCAHDRAILDIDNIKYINMKSY
jgi:hypothetical protein